MIVLSRKTFRLFQYVALLLTVSLVGPMPMSGQAAPHRPKIALVFSGGGARGLAHVGVIEWLEEHRIPVDIITGTSMGGLIAGMYATGMTAPEAHKFISSVDWDAALRPEPGYDDLAYRRKEDRRSYQLGIELGLKHGLTGPQGFNAGHGVAMIFDRAAYGYTEMRTFDDLPIPFRCVSTDLVTGDRVLLDDGSLAVACGQRWRCQVCLLPWK
jgi:NTE family protein